MLGNHLTLRSRGRLAFVVGAIAVGLALTGCDSGSGEGSADAASSEPVESSSAGPTNTYEVEAGDTLSGIAAGHGVSLSELIDTNEWSDGSDHAIFPGDVITLPDDAVAVSTAQPPSDNSNGDDANDDDNNSGESATSSTVPTAATSGGYEATGEFYVGPALDGSTDPIIEPLPDGVYWSFGPAVSTDGSTITFELVQQFSGDSCREHFVTTPDSCLSDIDFESALAAASMRVGSGTATVLYLHGGYDVEAYRTTSEELARLLAGKPPADDAPDDFQYGAHPFVVTVQNGSVTAADQIWIS